MDSRRCSLIGSRRSRAEITRRHTDLITIEMFAFAIEQTTKEEKENSMRKASPVRSRVRTSAFCLFRNFQQCFAACLHSQSGRRWLSKCDRTLRSTTTRARSTSSFFVPIFHFSFADKSVYLVVYRIAPHFDEKIWRGRPSAGA